MAFAKKCDRCGKLYEKYNTGHNSKNINGILTVNIDYKRQYYTNTLIDLCPECKDEFVNWLEKAIDDEPAGGKLIAKKIIFDESMGGHYTAFLDNGRTLPVCKVRYDDEIAIDRWETSVDDKLVEVFPAPDCKFEEGVL